MNHIHKGDHLPFKKGNLLVKEYAKQFKDNLDLVSKKYDSFLGFIATNDAGTESGILMSGCSNMNQLDITKAFISMGLKSKPMRTAMEMAVMYFKDEDEANKSPEFDVENMTIGQMIEHLKKEGHTKGGVVKVEGGKMEVVSDGDEAFDRILKDIKNGKEIAKRVKVSVGGGKKIAKKKINIKKLFGK